MPRVWWWWWYCYCWCKNIIMGENKEHIKPLVRGKFQLEGSPWIIRTFTRYCALLASWYTYKVYWIIQTGSYLPPKRERRGTEIIGAHQRGGGGSVLEQRRSERSRVDRSREEQKWEEWIGDERSEDGWIWEESRQEERRGNKRWERSRAEQRRAEKSR